MEEYAIDEPKSKKSLSEKLICEERETTEQQKNNKSKEWKTKYNFSWNLSYILFEFKLYFQ